MPASASLPDSVTLSLAIAIAIYLLVIFALSIWAQGRIHTAEDFIVAGRRLPLSLAWATLLATWFGAGTMIIQANEVKNEGLKQAALDPFGAGCCLLLAGLFYARPMWQMGITTVSDFFHRQFGSTAEVLSVFILVPSYFGWIAAQFVALAAILEAFFGIPQNVGMLYVALVGMSYTLMGGMWSVTLTDAVQIVLVILGLIILTISSLMGLGGGSILGGLKILSDKTELLQPVPVETLPLLGAWLGAFTAGALGNLPGQDLMQRVFAAKSAQTARNACLLAGVLYLLLGTMPLLLGLVGRMLFADSDSNVTIELAKRFLAPTPLLLVVFMLGLISVVLSTIDSAILSPATVLSQNLFEKWNRGRISPLWLNRISVLLVSMASLALAYSGEGAYELLEGAYELTLVGLFVPLTCGLFLPLRGQAPAIAAMIAGPAVWIVHSLLDVPDAFALAGLSTGIGATGISFFTYVTVWGNCSPVDNNEFTS
ncbi:MAG: sodium:solute symporter [Gemmatales bacterium]|nr:MAG: sodium:solute symporter [Gemmatales bacterium]